MRIAPAGIYLEALIDRNVCGRAALGRRGKTPMQRNGALQA